MHLCPRSEEHAGNARGTGADAPGAPGRFASFCPALAGHEEISNNCSKVALTIHNGCGIVIVLGFTSPARSLPSVRNPKRFPPLSPPGESAAFRFVPPWLSPNLPNAITGKIRREEVGL